MKLYSSVMIRKHPESYISNETGLKSKDGMNIFLAVIAFIGFIFTLGTFVISVLDNEYNPKIHLVIHKEYITRCIFFLVLSITPVVTLILLYHNILYFDTSLNGFILAMTYIGCIFIIIFLMCQIHKRTKNKQWSAWLISLHLTLIKIGLCIPFFVLITYTRCFDMNVEPLPLYVDRLEDINYIEFENIQKISRTQSVKPHINPSQITTDSAKELQTLEITTSPELSTFTTEGEESSVLRIKNQSTRKRN